MKITKEEIQTQLAETVKDFKSDLGQHERNITNPLNYRLVSLTSG